MKLYGRDWTRREMEARVGRIEQVGGLRRVKGAEGFEQDVEMIQVRTGAGLAYQVNPSRGLDISLAEFNGFPLSWQAAAGDVHPAYYDARHTEWLRTAVGGLLMTCGLTQVGAPCEEDGLALGQHGRIHHVPASQVAAEGRWDGDEYLIRIAGQLHQAMLFGENLLLTREITGRLGENRITLCDTIENLGFASAPHMLLYHFNLGFPLLQENTEINIPSQRVLPRTKDVPMDGYDCWQAPDPAYSERVYYHEDFDTDDECTTSVVILAPRFPSGDGHGTQALEFRLSWDTSQLPRMVEWKMPGAGAHVLGLEPANCHVLGRAAERQAGTLVMLEPGERRTCRLEVDVSVAG